MSKLWKALPLAVVSLAALKANAQYPGQLTTPTDAGALNSMLATESAAPISTNICDNFQKSEVVIDRQKVMRYKVDKGELLKCLPPEPAAPWIVVKEAWSQQDELNWQNFIRALGKGLENGVCNTVDTCLASSANIYRNQQDIDTTHFSDCADLPMYLRSYFAYKNQLPMSFGVGLTANKSTVEQIQEAELNVQRSEEKLNQMMMSGASQLDIEKREKSLKELRDILANTKYPSDTRYTRNGNYFSERVNIPHSKGYGRDFFKVVTQIHDQISSGSYRMLMTAPGQTPPDFYPIAVSKQTIKAGTVVYKPTGHVALVYDIKPNGEILMIQAHPDNSMTRVTYGPEYMRSLTTHAAGFKNWRPFTVTEAKKDAQGIITGGKIVFAQDNEIPGYSLEQYFGNADINNTNSANTKFVVGGRNVDWYDYVKIRMANGVYKLNPLAEFQGELNNLCVSLQGRATDVEAATLPRNNGFTPALNTEPHPGTLPRNIYGAEGDWEAYSTPSRDIRLRIAVINIFANLKKYMTKLQNNDPYFQYLGSNLKKDLIQTYHDVNAQCLISYTNSSGKKVSMGLSTALKRLTSISFDPYLCVERRWGASSQAELKSCADDNEKREWYTYQQFLRNLTERDPNAVMSWSLGQLKDMQTRGLVDAADHSKQYDILKALNEL